MSVRRDSSHGGTDPTRRSIQRISGESYATGRVRPLPPISKSPGRGFDPPPPHLPDLVRFSAMNVGSSRRFSGRGKTPPGLDVARMSTFEVVTTIGATHSTNGSKTHFNRCGPSSSSMIRSRINTSTESEERFPRYDVTVVDGQRVVAGGWGVVLSCNKPSINPPRPYYWTGGIILNAR